MKVVFIADHNCLGGEGGGAEMSEREVIMEGIMRGYDIHIVSPSSPILSANNLNQFLTFIADVDLAVIGNASRFSRQLLEKITETTEYVFYVHDFFPLCHYRLYFPDLDKCKTTCKNLPFTKKFMLNSSLNIFLSPLHFRVWQRVIPELADAPYHLHPSTIDPERFRPLEVPKVPNSVLGVNSLLQFKGRDNVLDYAKHHPDKTFTFVGGIEPGTKLLPNCHYIGWVPQVEMPGMYAQSEYVVHLPSTVEPFSRICMEAYLCGAKIIGNKLIGAFSYPQFKSKSKRKKYNRDELAEWLVDGPKRFWKRLEGEVL